jgi:hypothetical protein
MTFVPFFQPGSFRPTINPQADASWNGSGTKRTYDRDFLLKFQTVCPSPSLPLAPYLFHRRWLTYLSVHCI